MNWNPIAMKPFEYTGRNWSTIIGWGFIGLVAILGICAGIVILPYGWLGIAFLIGGMAFLWASWHFGRRAFAIKHLIVEKDRLIYFRGKTKLIDAGWDELSDLRYSPKMTSRGTSSIRMSIGGKELVLTGEEDLPPWEIRDIFLVLETAWKEATVIEVQVE